MTDLPPRPVLIAPGVWRATTPLPFRPRFVHAYLLRTGADWMLVDGGANTGDAWAELDAAVRAAAGGWDRVAAHLVTHMHLDHVGLVERVRAASGARLLMGALDAQRAAHARAHPDEEAAYRAALLRRGGALEAIGAGVEEDRREADPLQAFVPVDVELAGDGGELAEAPGWRWLWTPGHTAGHVSLFRPEDGTLVAGDAVLPRITPTLGVNRQRADPVGDYLATLDRLDALGIARVLPGHGEPVEAPHQRIAELRRGAEAETEAVAELLAEGPCTAWEAAQRRHPYPEYPPAVLMHALRETLAHLDRLVLAGRAREGAGKDGAALFSAVRG